MRARRIALLAGLLGLLNLAELGLIAYLAGRKPSPPPTPTAVSVSTTRGNVPNSPPVPTPFDWRNLESADYKTYIANLRAIGCPEETVRDIIIADVDKLLASRTRSVAPQRSAQYWEPEEREVTTFRTDENQDQALEKEKRDLLKGLLGIDYYAERRKSNGDEDARDRRLAFLPQAKREQLRAVLDKYSELEHAFEERTSGRRGDLSAEERAELKNLRETRQSEIATLLTPAESQLYELWMSNAGVSARFAMGGMDQPNEHDFLVIYNIRKQFEGRLNAEAMKPDDPGLLEALSKESAQAEEQIRAQLGEERYAQYQRGQDAAYRQLAEIARQYNLPQVTAAKIYELKKLVEQAAVKNSSSQTPNEPGLSAALAPIRRQADQSVREWMGENAYQYYRRNGNADWLNE